MKKLIIILIIISTIMVLGCERKEQDSKNNVGYASEINYNAIAKQDLLCLMKAYPGYIKGVERKADKSIYIVMKSGKRILYDDKKIKNFDQMINNPDIQDMMSQIYPLAETKNIMNETFSPGRARVYDFFNEIYGASKAAVESNLMHVRISNKKYSFNRNNYAAAALNSAIGELMPLAQKKAVTKSYVFPISGTFNYRYIEGTKQLSGHSYGIAIDLAGNKGEYWRWMSRIEAEKRIKSYPMEIVKIFENNNFIWGGKWGQFDMMHFEFRPELILKSKYFGPKSAAGAPWYNKLPLTDPKIKKYVEIINKAFM